MAYVMFVTVPIAITTVLFSKS